MGKTSIEWTDASWNPIVGCTEVSPGCANCYAARLASTRLKNHKDYFDLAISKADCDVAVAVLSGIAPDAAAVIKEKAEGIHHRWTRKVRFLPERLDEPRHWKTPRRIFVCDMGDLFHEGVQDEVIDRVCAVMVACRWHTFQVLTKRAARMREYFSNLTAARVCKHLQLGEGTLAWPIRNLWLGVSVENQHFADERISLLLATPAAVRWISAEPLLSLVNVSRWVKCGVAPPDGSGLFPGTTPKLDWVVCGGESGPNARPMDQDWARSLRDQCQAAGVPFFFKQWGEWSYLNSCPKAAAKVGKKKAGRLLDGREWNEFPGS